MPSYTLAGGAKLRCIALALTLAVFGLPSTLLAAPKQLIFSHVVGPDTPKGKMALMFKNLVEEKMGDRYEIVIHDNASLMSDVEAVDAIAAGSIHFAAPALSKFVKYTEKLKVFDLPFLFPDMEAVNRFQDSTVGRLLLTSMMDQGILGLGYLHNGLKQMTANRPFALPEDLAGLRFRVINSDVLKKQFEVINAEPIPIPWPDTYEALKTNRVDGQENTWSNIFTSEFYRYQPYMMASNHGVLGYMVITNTDLWAGISKPDKRRILYALKVALAYGNAVAVAKSRNDRIELGNMKGVVLSRPTKAQLEAWQSVMKPIWREYEPVIGKTVVDAAREASAN